MDLQANVAGIDAAKAIWALRVAAGLALIVVAFAGKLASPEPALRSSSGTRSSTSRRPPAWA